MVVLVDACTTANNESCFKSAFQSLRRSHPYRLQEKLIYEKLTVYIIFGESNNLHMYTIDKLENYSWFKWEKTIPLVPLWNFSFCSEYGMGVNVQ